MAVTASEYVATCDQLERDHGLWVAAGRPSVATKYSGVVTWA